MARYSYRSLSRDGLCTMIREARIVAAYDPGSIASRWNWNKCVPAVSAPGSPATLIVPLEIKVESAEEFADLKNLVLEIKEAKQV